MSNIYVLTTPPGPLVPDSLTSLTPPPRRQKCDLLVLMWSSAEAFEDESSLWWSGSLSLSSMEANTALSI